jgi:hypothetical protein
MRFFGKQQPDPIRGQIEEQQKVSKDTLEFMRSVLSEKDRLLAEAINQTGRAVRTGRRVKHTQ